MTLNPSNMEQLRDFGEEDPGYGLRPVAGVAEANPERRRFRASHWAFFGLGFLVGAGIGAGAALLLAPRTGRESRRLLQSTTESLVQRTSEAVQAAGIPERLAILAERTGEAVAAAALPERLSGLAERTTAAVAAANLPERLAGVSLPAGLTRLPERVAASAVAGRAGERLDPRRGGPFWRRWRAA